MIEVKTNFHPKVILAPLYKHTPLQRSFGISMMASVDGEARTLGLRAALQVFADHRIEIIRRRSEFRLCKKRERLHLVDGLLTAVLNLDEAIEAICSSDDSMAARTRLIPVFDLLEPQAEYILELKLCHLTKLSHLELEAETDGLRAAIAELETVLVSTRKLYGVVHREFQDTVTALSSPRRTLLLEGDGTVVVVAEDDLAPAVGVTLVSEAPLEVTSEPYRTVRSATGEAARIDAPVSPEHSVGILIASSCETRARGIFGMAIPSGFVVRLDALTLPLAKIVTDGEGMTWSFEGVPPLMAAAGLEEGETVVGILSLDEDEIVGVITESGVIKRMYPDYPSTQNRLSITNLDDTNQMVFVGVAGDDAQFILVSMDAQLLRTPASTVRPQGRNVEGVAGMSLRPSTKVLVGAILPELEVASTVVVTIVTVMDAMLGANQSPAKLMPLDRYPTRSQGGQGVCTQRFLKDEHVLDKALVG